MMICGNLFTVVVVFRILVVVIVVTVDVVFVW